MTTKFCSSCRRHQNAELGHNVKNKTGRIVRWRCNSCQIRAQMRMDHVELEANKLNESSNKEN